MAKKQKKQTPTPVEGAKAGGSGQSPASVGQPTQPVLGDTVAGTWERTRADGRSEGGDS